MYVFWHSLTIERILSMKKLNITVKELMLGIFIYFVVALAVGLIFAKARLMFALGLLLGCLVACILSIHMYYTLDKGLSMDPDSATKYIRNQSFLRLFFMLLALFAGRVLGNWSFIAVIVGIFSLKISAFFQPFINKYISDKIFKEGR